MNKLILMLLLAFAAGCSSPQKLTTINVASQQVDCQGVTDQKCLLVKIGNQKEWENFYDSIEGFTYEEGFEYVLEVAESTVENPPADASSISYKLVKQISKTKK